MFLSNKIVYGYAIALSFTFLGSMAGLLWGNSVHQEALQKSLAISQEHRFLNELELNILYNRPAEQLLPYLKDPASFRRESSKFLDHIQKILTLLENHKYPEKAPSVQGLQSQLDEYEVFVKKFRQEAQKLIDRIEPLTASPKTLQKAELQLAKLVKDENFVQFIEFPDRLSPFVKIVDQLERDADAELIQAKVTRITIYVTSLVLSAAISAIFIIKMSRALARDQADANQKLKDRLIERQLSEAALQKSEAHQRALISAIPDILMRISQAGIYLEFVATPSFNVVGNLSNLVGKPVTEGLPPAASKDRMKFIQLALQTNSIQVYEQDLSIDGKMQIEEVRIVPYGEDEVLALVRDITDRKQAELALKQSELTNRVIVETIPDLLIQMDREGRFLQMAGGGNVLVKPLCKSFNEELDIYKVLSSEMAEQRLYYTNQAIESSSLQIYEQIIDVDGNLRHEEVRIAPLNDREVLIIIRDITDRKQTEQQLQQINQVLESRVKERTLELQERETQLMKLSERLALALKSGAIGCWEWDLVQNTKIWDDRMYTLYGVTEKVAPSKIHDIWTKSVHPDDLRSTEIMIQQSALGQAEYDTEFRVFHPDGSIHFIKAYGMLERDVEGKPCRMIGVNFDISDRKRAEAQLQQTNDELLRATRLKDEFLANMSHELRTPLNAILGITEGLQDQVYGDLNEKQLKVLQTVERSGSHLLELINDILDLAKIEAGQIELDCQPTAINHLCQSSMAFIRQHAMQKHIHLDFKLCHNPPHLLVDERRIRQVLINLLNNAVKFTPEGGQVTLEVSPATPVPVIDDRSPQQFLDISVSDTGIGISPENIKRLFQPFIQVDSALNRQYEGTGLGLALVKRIVELHGGIVRLTSELGVGSCFTISLPYCFSSELARDLNSGNTIVVASPNINATSLPALILIAEDNESNVMTFTSYLEANGYRVLWAKNGQEAIALAKSHRPNLILMDIQMPIMDGLAATEQIRLDASLSNIPIIALTALAKESDREKCLAAGVNDYLSKPVKLKELITKMQILLERTANLYES